MAFAVLFAVLNTIRGVVGTGLDVSKALRHAALDPQLVRVIDMIRDGFFLHALIAGAVLVAASSVVALRSGAFAGWIGWLGGVVALLVLVGSPFVPSLVVDLLLLWFVVVAVALAYSTAGGRPATEDGPGSSPPA